LPLIPWGLPGSTAFPRSFPSGTKIIDNRDTSILGTHASYMLRDAEQMLLGALAEILHSALS
jgi:hypothetical protein